MGDNVVFWYMYSNGMIKSAYLPHWSPPIYFFKFVWWEHSQIIFFSHFEIFHYIAISYSHLAMPIEHQSLLFSNYNSISVTPHSTFSHPSPVSGSHLSSMYVYEFDFFLPHVNNIIWYLFLYVRHISLNIMSFGFIHGLTSGIISIF